jgi:ParB-like chromosome segregation protein Spo0J
MRSNTMRSVPIAQITARPGQRPQDYSPAEVESFAGSIAATGRVENPPLIRETAADRFELVAGGLRVAAEIFRGQTHIVCHVRELSDGAARAVAVLEDLCGKRKHVLRTGWALLDAMEATGWDEPTLVALTGRKRSVIHEAVRSARAVPRTLLDEVAETVGLPVETAEQIGREKLRSVRSREDPGERREALEDALREMRDKAPRGGGPARPHADGGAAAPPVRVDPAEIGRLTLLGLLRAAVQMLCLLVRTWWDVRRRSPTFAGRTSPSQNGRAGAAPARVAEVTGTVVHPALRGMEAAGRPHALGSAPSAGSIRREVRGRPRPRGRPRSADLPSAAPRPPP